MCNLLLRHVLYINYVSFLIDIFWVFFRCSNCFIFQFAQFSHIYCNSSHILQQLLITGSYKVKHFRQFMIDQPQWVLGAYMVVPTPRLVRSLQETVQRERRPGTETVAPRTLRRRHSRWAGEGGCDWLGQVLCQMLPTSWQDTSLLKRWRVIKQELNKPVLSGMHAGKTSEEAWLHPFPHQHFWRAPSLPAVEITEFVFIYSYLVLFNIHLELTVCQALF